MIAQDYSVWLDREGQLAAEERGWAENHEKEVYAGYLKRLFPKIGHVPTVLELGCGTGWVPALLVDTQVLYAGVDGNAGCVELARRKTKHQFHHADLRTFELWAPVDIVCAFAVLKHFALVEWNDVVAKVLRHGRYGIFTMRIGERDLDDLSRGFPHTLVSLERLRSAVAAAGHALTALEPSSVPGVDTVVMTERLA